MENLILYEELAHVKLIEEENINFNSLPAEIKNECKEIKLLYRLHYTKNPEKHKSNLISRSIAVADAIQDYIEVDFEDAAEESNEKKDGNGNEKKDGNGNEKKDDNGNEKKDGNENEKKDGNENEKKDGDKNEKKDGDKKVGGNLFGWLLGGLLVGAAALVGVNYLNKK